CSTGGVAADRQPQTIAARSVMCKRTTAATAIMCSRPPRPRNPCALYLANRASRISVRCVSCQGMSKGLIASHRQASEDERGCASKDSSALCRHEAHDRAVRQRGRVFLEDPVARAFDECAHATRIILREAGVPARGFLVLVGVLDDDLAVGPDDGLQVLQIG